MTSIEFRNTYVDPESSPAKEHAFALEYWNQKRGPAFAPRWKDIDLMAFPPRVIPRINVVDVDTATGVQRYRFWGTALTAVHRGDYTGKAPADVPPLIFGKSAGSGYARLVRERAPNLEVKEFTGPNGILGRELVLRLPLTDGGDEVCHGMAVCSYEQAEPRAPLFHFFENILKPLAAMVP